MKPKINWDGDGFTRTAMCGDAVIGEVHDKPRGGRYYRWRCWTTGRFSTSSGVARSLEDAKAAVESQYAVFLELAGLVAKE